MATPTNAQLGKLLASYFSTSNDALAITFRKHYSPTTSSTPFRKPKAKRPTPRLTTATFTYRWLTTAPQRITTLYQYLLRAKWIATETLIWQSMLSSLNDEQATELANRFDFSGGQIQNISRKQVINAIFSGKDELNYDQIKLDCQNESISRNSRGKVGF